MSKWLAAIKLVVLVLSWWFEKDKASRARKKEALDMVCEGIEQDDPSKITAGFARAKR